MIYKYQRVDLRISLKWAQGLWHWTLAESDGYMIAQGEHDDYQQACADASSSFIQWTSH
jgi:hypothetical protein